MVTRQALLSLVTDSIPVIAEDLTGPLLELLSYSRGACGGDLDKLLILLVVAIRTAGHKSFATYTQAQLLSGELPVFPSLGVNIQSIADSIGAPKETVRRKVADLVRIGWIERQGNDLFFTACAYRSLAPVSARVAGMAVRYHEVVAALIARPPEAP